MGMTFCHHWSRLYLNSVLKKLMCLLSLYLRKRNGTHRLNACGVWDEPLESNQNQGVTLKLAFSYSCLLLTVCNLWKSHLTYSQVIKCIFLSIVVQTFTKYLVKTTNINYKKNPWPHLGNENLPAFTTGNQFVQLTYLFLCNPYSLWPKNMV